MEEVKTLIRKSADTPGTTEAITPPNLPNIVVQVMAPAKMVAIRVLRVYIQSLLGFLTVSLTGIDQAVGIPLDQFGNGFKVAALLAVAPTVFTLLQNTLEILTKLDVTNPELRA